MGCVLTRADVSLESDAFPEPGLLRAQGKPAGADAWPLAAATQSLWLQPIPDAQCAQHTKVCSALEVHLLCVFSGVLLPPASLHSPSLPFCLEKERQKKNISHIWYYATMTAACDCLLGWFFTGNGQDAGMVKKDIWNSLQLLDTMLLL